MFYGIRGLIIFLLSKKPNLNQLNLGFEKMLEANGPYKVKLIIKKICEFEYCFAESVIPSKVIGKIEISDLLLFKAQRDTSRLLSKSRFSVVIADYFLHRNNLVYPLKKNWQNIFSENGIKVNKGLCTLLWRIYLFVAVIESGAMYCKQAISSLKVIKTRSNEKLLIETPFVGVYFYDIRTSNLPMNMSNDQGKNLVNWYKKNVLHGKAMNVFHNCKSYVSSNIDSKYMSFTYNKNLFFQISFFQEIKIFIWWLWFLLKNIVSIYRLIILLTISNEIIKVKKIERFGSKVGINKIVFNNSIGAIKPLWAVELERNEICIDYCFYACYGEPSDLYGNLPLDGFWALSTWNNFYVVDKQQMVELNEKTLCKSSTYKYESIPWWTDYSYEIPISTKRSICLFDTILSTEVYTLGTLNQFGWNKVETAVEYLKIVLETAADLNLNVVYKLKRPRAKSNKTKEHLNEIDSLMKRYKSLVTQVDYRISPERLILATDFTISKPVSTTALIAKSLNKPSIYLDPTGMIKSTDQALRQIKILSDKNELKSFLSFPHSGINIGEDNNE